MKGSRVGFDCYSGYKIWKQLLNVSLKKIVHCTKRKSKYNIIYLIAFKPFTYFPYIIMNHNAFNKLSTIPYILKVLRSLKLNQVC